MNNTIYPLGHDVSELERLDQQAQLLNDPLLEKLAGKAKNCLEIGCGNGSNLPLLRNANPNLKYTGIDIASTAIDAAKLRYGSDVNAEFKVMDAQFINLEPGSFDLIFVKLVLWSLGPEWATVLKEVHRLLAPGGVFYSLEPCNQMVELFPEKPAVKAWMNNWDQAALQSGLNPFIGTEISGGLKRSGFENVDSKFFPVIASGTETERYTAIIKNLKGFYMGPALEHMGLPPSAEQKKKVNEEFDSFNANSLVMDALYVSWGYKSA